MSVCCNVWVVNGGVDGNVTGEGGGAELVSMTGRYVWLYRQSIATECMLCKDSTFEGDVGNNKVWRESGSSAGTNPVLFVFGLLALHRFLKGECGVRLVRSRFLRSDRPQRTSPPPHV